MITEIGSRLRITNPSPDMVDWCKKHLEIPNPEYQKKARMNLWLGDTPRTLVMYEVDGDSVIIPFGCLRSILPLLEGDVKKLFTKQVKVDYKGAKVPLYDYQEEAVGAMIINHYGILQSPAGSGKTQIGIVSNAGKEVTNPMQALGSSITYLRRYLWMAVLDITEPDDIDATLGSEPEEEEPEIEAPNPEKAKTEKKSQKKQKAPATPAERKEAKETLTDTEGQADDLQIAALKNACKELMEKDPDQEDFVQQIAMKTNGFTQVTRSQCEQLIKNLGEMIAAYKTEG